MTLIFHEANIVTEHDTGKTLHVCDDCIERPDIVENPSPVHFNQPSNMEYTEEEIEDFFKCSRCGEPFRSNLDAADDKDTS